MASRPNTPAYRGVLEGFYGPRWSHQDRLSLLEWMPRWNMNLYVYSARNDPYHRYGWATPYPRQEMRRFEELARHAAENKVQFSIAISPGNTFDPSRKEHRRQLMAKLRQFSGVGCRLFPIFYDDMSEPVDFNGPSGAAHAEKQASVFNYFVEKLTERTPEARVLCCPTEYGSAKKSAYLSRLHERLDRRVEVLCTSVDEPGPEASSRTHCPRTWARTFSNDGARSYFRNFGRKPFLWDNFNCADFALNQLNWSPYQGRGDRLNELCAGILLNPQHVALMNWPVFGAVGEYLANPRRYHPRGAMNRSLDASMGRAGGVIGRELSKWYTTEWTGYLSSDENLPDLEQGLSGTTARRRRFLRQVKNAVTPLLSLDDRFNRTLMPPDWACHLSGYVNLLKGWAGAVEALCDAAMTGGPITHAQARAARQALDQLRRQSYRMPESLLLYLERMATRLR